MKEILTIIILFCILICVALCRIPKNKREQMLDDEAQMQYIKEIKENKKNIIKNIN